MKEFSLVGELLLETEMEQVGCGDREMLSRKQAQSSGSKRAALILPDFFSESACRETNQSLLTVVILKKTAVAQTFCQAHLKSIRNIEKAPSETSARRYHFRPCCAEKRLSSDSDSSLPRQSHPGTLISISGLMSTASGASYSLRLKSLPLHQAAINHVGSR